MFVTFKAGASGLLMTDFLENFCNCSPHNTGEQGWRSAESARISPLWPGFDSWTWRHMWVEFVVGSRPCSEGFSPGSLVFLPPQKPTLKIPIRPGKIEQRATSWKCHCKIIIIIIVNCYYKPQPILPG